MASLRTIPVDEFIRRLNEARNQEGTSYAFFLGAGCSISSGIPAAGALVRDRWLPRLRELKEPHRDDMEAWVKKIIPEYDPQNPAASYGPVLERLFLQPAERQKEIEDLCDGRFPGFGYAVLSNLVGDKGGTFNIVLTTNFDDLVPDGLYLFTASPPLVIQHESLAAFIRPTRTKPLVVKLHGDHRLAPRNTSVETERLKAEVAKSVQTLLHDRGLIFLGYGGNDVGIKKMLESLQPEALQFGAYWISSKEPEGEIRPWLESRNAVWVEYGDFDELMLLVRNEFDLPHPNRKRFDDVFDRYFETYEALSSTIASRTDTRPETTALKQAVKQTDETFTNWGSVELMARRFKQNDPEKANQIYLQGIEDFPDSASLLGNYAVFLTEIRKDHDRSEEHYKRALAADPEHANNLGNYANFLKDIRKDHGRAEEYYQRALAADPNGVYNLSNYSGFLLAQGRDQEGLSMLRTVLGNQELSECLDLALECWFYLFAHGTRDRCQEALKNLKELLSSGERSLGWNLKPNVERARHQGHPDIEWLEKLAAVITGNTDIDSLNDWPDWQNA